MYLVVRKQSNVKVYNKDLITAKTKENLQNLKYEIADSLDEVMLILNKKNKEDLCQRLYFKHAAELIGELSPIIKEKTEKVSFSYIQNNDRYGIVRKSSSDQKIDAVVLSAKNYAVVDLGPFRPLELTKVYDFLQDPSIEQAEDRQKTIGEVICEELSFKKEEILPLIKVNTERAEREFVNYFLESEFFLNWVQDKIKEGILELSYGMRSSELARESFFDFCKRIFSQNDMPLPEVEYITECNEVFQKIIYDAVQPFIYTKKIPSPVTLHKKEITSKRNAGVIANFRHIQGDKIPNSVRLINKRLATLRDYLKRVRVFEEKLKKPGEDTLYPINEIVMEIARLEAVLYEIEEIPINISDIVASEKCAFDMLWYGLDYVMNYTYVNEETKKGIIRLIPESPEKEYPEAREMKRHFILHYGPTNSGKTFQAIESLKNAKSGVYLGPLRLLALEIQDNLMQDGILCSLLTGEEEDTVEGACHMASTVEKLDTTEKYDVCVIDEAQMIDDPERGFAWTRAVLGVLADTIHICMAPEALDIIKKLIKLCGDTYEEVEHTRRSELVVQNTPLNLTKKNIEDGDAYIVFSKRKVLQVAAELVKKDIKVSMIYGNLPYPVRKEQVRRFIEGDTQVVVSTNAIGMGINLPVRRIIFLEDSKFNGREIAPLTITDVKQIAGRAGRNKETGYVASMLGNADEIKNMLDTKTPDIKNAYLGFSDVIISIDAPLNDILRVWRSISTPNMFKRMDIDRYIKLDECIYVDVTKKQKLKMISIPFDERNEDLLEQWKSYCFLFEKGEPELPPPVCKGATLQPLEEYCQSLDLWYSFARNFGYSIDLEWLREEKSKTSEKINDILVKNVDMFQKKCEICGTQMHWSNPYKTCKKCHDAMYYDYGYADFMIPKSRTKQRGKRN